MKQKFMPDSRQWSVKLFVQNMSSNEKLLLMVFHRHLAKILTEEEITDILLKCADMNISYDITDNKRVQVNA